MRHASTRETREGTGNFRGIASKTKTTRELNYCIANLPARLLLRVLAQSWYSLYIKFTSQNSYERLVGGPFTVLSCSQGSWRSKYKQHCWVEYDSTGGVRQLTKCPTCSYCAHDLSRENSLNNTNINNNNNRIFGYLFIYHYWAGSTTDMLRKKEKNTIIKTVWIFSTLFR